MVGGFSLHVASSSKDWPMFKHLLPEIVFAGHSNSGKVCLYSACLSESMTFIQCRVLLLMVCLVCFLVKVLPVLVKEQVGLTKSVSIRFAYISLIVTCVDICWQLGKKPPVMTLVDFPGYGHAIATVDDRREWITMTRDYLANRSIITRYCFILGWFNAIYQWRFM